MIRSTPVSTANGERLFQLVSTPRYPPHPHQTHRPAGFIEISDRYYSTPGCSSVPRKVPRAQDGDPRSWMVEEFPGTTQRVERVQSPVVSTQGHPPPPTQNRKLAGFAEISDRSRSTLGCSSVTRKARSPTPHQHAGQIGRFDRRVLWNPRRHSLPSPSQPSLYLTLTSLPTTHIHRSLLNTKNDYIRPQIRQATR